jgi:hypothetical protein
MSLTPHALQANRAQFDSQDTGARCIQPSRNCRIASRITWKCADKAHMEGDFAGVPIGGDDNIPDPLQQYPRMNPHAPLGRQKPQTGCLMIVSTPS